MAFDLLSGGPFIKTKCLNTGKGAWGGTQQSSLQRRPSPGPKPLSFYIPFNKTQRRPLSIPPIKKVNCLASVFGPTSIAPLNLNKLLKQQVCLSFRTLVSFLGNYFRLALLTLPLRQCFCSARRGQRLPFVNFFTWGHTHIHT